MKLTQSQKDLKQVTEELQFKEREASQSMRMNVKERDDLVKSYNMACEENSRQKVDIETLYKEKVGLVSQLQKMDQELGYQNLRIEEMGKKEQSYLKELQGQERQINQLVEELQEAKFMLKEAAEAKQNVLSEAEHSRQVKLLKKIAFVYIGIN